MRAVGPARAWLCPLAALLWVAGGLAWWEGGAAASRVPTPPTARARVTPAPEAPAPSARPPTPARQPLSVGPSDLARGTGLLDGAGSFPALICSYDDFPSFLAYARAMQGLGARFVAVRNREIVGSIDLEAERISGEVPRAAFSPRARDYALEPGLVELARAARDRFGAGTAIMMLVPHVLDAGLFGGIAGALAERAEGVEEFREIRGRYERHGEGGRGVRLRVDAALRGDGRSVALDLVFDLAQIVDAAGVGPGRGT